MMASYEVSFVCPKSDVCFVVGMLSAMVCYTNTKTTHTLFTLPCFAASIKSAKKKIQTLQIQTNWQKNH